RSSTPGRSGWPTSPTSRRSTVASGSWTPLPSRCAWRTSSRSASSTSTLPETSCGSSAGTPASGPTSATALRHRGEAMITAQAVQKDAETRMHGALEALGREFAGVRTRRANGALLEHVRVDYYGTRTPLYHAASISVPDALSLPIQAWEQGVLKKIEQAIQKSDLGLTPANDGKVIRLTIPHLNEERRKQLAKSVGKLAEDARVAIRNVRREAKEKIKALLKDKKISEDDERRSEVELQKLTDRSTQKVDELLKKKEQEILEF